MGNNETGGTPNPEGGKKPTFHVSKEPVVHGKPVEDAHKYEATVGEPAREGSQPPAGPSSEPPLYEDLGTLPAGYGSKSLFLIARDPRWLFSYWDIDWAAYPSSRMRGGKVVLKVYNADGGEVYSAEIDPDARNWYVPVSQGNASFYGEIGFFNEADAWEVIVRSNDATTPSDSISEVIADNFATVPYHLAFQKVLETVKAGMGEGESLLSALARIQNEGRKLMFLLGASPEWTDDQRRLLAALLGNEVEEILGLSSVEIDILLRKQLKERLFSELGSGLAAQMGAGGASLFSAFAAFGSWVAVGSWTEAAQGSLLSSWLSSWVGGETAGASWLASWGGPVESSFWSSYLSSWSGVRERAALSSWLASWVGAGEVGALSSWLASWSGVKEVSFWSSYLASWGGKQESAALSSWLASWGGVLEISSVSSWLASWSGMSEVSFWSSWLSSWAGAKPEVLGSWLSSWVGVKGGEFWSSWLSSWAGGQVEVGSWLASWYGGQSAVSSFLSSWFSAEIGVSSWLSSWAAAGESSFWSSLAGSWPSAAGVSSVWSSWLASWPGAIGASESRLFWSSWLASWSHGYGASEAFGSEGFTVGDLGASWSAHPFGGSQEFVLELGAEVVFFGGTNPGAKLWVEGRPVAISSDGSFRYQCKLPAGDYAMPIVAESPAGERRTAVLRFERNAPPTAGRVRYPEGGAFGASQDRARG